MTEQEQINRFLATRGATRVAESATALIGRLDVRNRPQDTRMMRAEIVSNDGRCEDAPCCGCCYMMADGRMMIRGRVR